jgi:hypothetical protein
VANAFKDVLADMKEVLRRLTKATADKQTQVLQQRIVDALAKAGESLRLEWQKLDDRYGAKWQADVRQVLKALGERGRIEVAFVRELLALVSKKLRAAQLKLKNEVLPDLGDKNLGRVRLSAKASCAEEIEKVIRGTGKEVGDLHAALTRVVRAMPSAKIPPKTVRGADEVLCVPLGRMLDPKHGSWKGAEEATRKLRAILENGRQGRAEAGQEADKRLDQLLRQLAEVQDEMDRLTYPDTLLRGATEIERDQRRVSETLRAHQKYLTDALLKEFRDG